MADMRGLYVDETSCDPQTAEVGYPPCEFGVQFKFLPQVGHTYKTFAVHTTGNLGGPPTQLVIQQHDSDSGFYLFKLQVAHPSADKFSKQCEVQVAVPAETRIAALVTVEQVGPKTMITVKQRNASFGKFKG